MGPINPQVLSLRIQKTVSYITKSDYSISLMNIHEYYSSDSSCALVSPYSYISAHTALAVKACLLGGNSNTKCSMTFVNIAVAISALAGGGGPKTVSHRDQTPKTVSHRDQNTVVFSTFFEDFWVSERKRVLKWNFGSFW